MFRIINFFFWQYGTRRQLPKFIITRFGNPEGGQGRHPRHDRATNARATVVGYGPWLHRSRGVDVHGVDVQHGGEFRPQTQKDVRTVLVLSSPVHCVFRGFVHSRYVQTNADVYQNVRSFEFLK